MEDTSTHKRVRLSENVIPDSQQEPNPMSPPMTPRHSSSELYPKISEIKGGINGVKNPAIQGQGQETRLVMGALPKHESTLEGLNGRQKGSGRCSRRAQGWSKCACFKTSESHSAASPDKPDTVQPAHDNSISPETRRTRSQNAETFHPANVRYWPPLDTLHDSSATAHTDEEQAKEIFFHDYSNES